MSETAVEVRDLWFSYDAAPVLREVSFRVEAGELVTVIGPNGGGKTTLLKILLGLLPPDAGEVRVFGRAPGDARGLMGYTPQHAVFDPQFPVTVEEVVHMGCLGRSFLGRPTRADREAATRALESVDLAEVGRRPFSDLSGGQKQRVLIARALASRPRVLFLDEPTANLDADAETEFLTVLRNLREEITVLVVSHDVGFVSETMDKVLCVNRTTAIHPTTELTGAAVTELYGADVRLVRHDHDCSRGEAEDGRP